MDDGADPANDTKPRGAALLASLPTGDLSVDYPLGTLRVTHRIAETWLKALLDPDGGWDGLLLAVTDPQDALRLGRHLSSGAITEDDLIDIAREVLSAGAGRPWWVAVNLVAVACECWETLSGAVARTGVSPERASFGMWLDVVWGEILRSAPDERSAETLREAVTSQPIEESPDDLDDWSMSEDEFTQAASGFTRRPDLGGT